MPKTIQQRVTLPSLAERLYDMYLDPKVHRAFTGSPVTINSKPGSEFPAFSDMLSGRMLYAVLKRLIVQSWRVKHWKPEVLDSISILTFWPEGNSGRIELVHVNVADHDFQGSMKAGKDITGSRGGNIRRKIPSRAEASVPLQGQCMIRIHPGEFAKTIQNCTTRYPFPRRIPIIPFSPTKWAAPMTTK